ncbi:hypothetical protein COU96_02470 [Candidatus Shapirobacteria bacterium CG10_big_fil_rev_8_21_14_0_10_38_14]|uniref:TVP38/TMEM64 family membrane protein n=1 Tax=Candidatus Shapirobacteria bacterium CG10_big_fil_rev_8_21_14_0_10_38_14 TaxID=1974483 RepID=A0A2M8L529_9BACT|nr:MAG: hypothetical protein COU96_02470 [Candidatus Shapirobacteria bacterium CG10_big_fil_rev_8_21_14_0_10_38_14]
MLKEFTLNLIEAIKQSGPKSVFLAGLIEQIVSPIPSVLIPTSAGFLLISKELKFWSAIAQIFSQISLPYALGATAGTTVLYLAAFYGGRALIEKFGKFFGLSIKHIDRFKNKFTRGFKDEVIIFLLVALPATPISLVAASCGVIGITALEFYPLIFVGTLVRSLFLGWLGWQAGEAYQTVSSDLSKAENLLTFLGVGVGVAIVAFLYLKRQKILKD